MRRTIIALAATLLASLSTATAPVLASDRRTPPRCPPAHEQVLAADVQAVLYGAEVPSSGAGGVFGCAYRSKRSYYLGRASSAGSSGSVSTYPIALAGPVVAFGEGKSFTFGHSFEEVWVRNLLTGKVIHRVPNGSPAEPGDVGLGDTTAIVVKEDGSVAWIVGAGEQLGGVQVRSLDKTGGHLLAASPEIEPNSLALAGSTLYWTQGGKPFSAQLQ
jgi:hypothetical protein